MTNNQLAYAGRIIYALPFVVFGILHFMNATAMAGIVPAYIPGGAFWVYLTGLAFLAAAVAMLVGRYVRLAGILLAAMLAIFVLTIHVPAALAGGSLGQLLKDTALAGGALMAASFGMGRREV